MPVVPPDVVIVTFCAPNGAPAATAKSAVIVVALTTLTR